MGINGYKTGISKLYTEKLYMCSRYMHFFLPPPVPTPLQQLSVYTPT